MDRASRFLKISVNALTGQIHGETTRKKMGPVCLGQSLQVSAGFPSV